MQIQHRINCLLFLFLIGMLFPSCEENNRTQALKHAYLKLNDHPKDALDLLESISNPETMDEADYMLYLLTKTDAKLKDKQDVTNDTLIYLAQKFYNEKNDLQKAALVNYYAGKVSYNRDIYDKSLSSYLKAEYYSRKINDDLLTARSLHSIANLYYIQQSMDSAIIHYKEANTYYAKTEGSKRNRLLAYQQIGRIYEDMANLDSALVYFEKGSVLATELNDSNYKTTFTFLKGVVLWEKGDYKQSEEYLYKALNETKNDEEALKIHLNLARLYIKMGKLDAAQSHLDEIKSNLSKISDNIGLRSVYTSLVDFYTLNSDYKEAIYYEKLIGKINLQISEEGGLEKLQNAENKYRIYVINREADEARQKLKTILGLSIGACVLFILIVAFVLWVKRLKREKENEILQQKIESLTFLQEIYQHIISDWVGIDNEVKKLAKEYGATEEPELYKRIKQLISDIREKSNIRLLENAKAEIIKLEHGEEILSLLTEQEQLILYLRQQRYDKKEITAIIGKGINHTYFMDLKRKLKQVGLSEKAIEELLFSRESRM